MEWMPWGPSAEELRCIWGYQLSEQVCGARVEELLLL
jgi:hypothetical protein